MRNSLTTNFSTKPWQILSILDKIWRWIQNLSMQTIDCSHETALLRDGSVVGSLLEQWFENGRPARTKARKCILNHFVDEVAYSMFRKNKGFREFSRFLNACSISQKWVFEEMGFSFEPRISILKNGSFLQGNSLLFLSTFISCESFAQKWVFV